MASTRKGKLAGIRLSASSESKMSTSSQYLQILGLGENEKDLNSMEYIASGERLGDHNSRRGHCLYLVWDDKEAKRDIEATYS